MSLTLALVVAAGASSVKHGTAEQCTSWYPREVVKQVECEVIVLTPEQKANQDELMRLCDELSATAESRGFVLTSVKFKDERGESSCNEWDKSRPSRPQSGG